MYFTSCSEAKLITGLYCGQCFYPDLLKILCRQSFVWLLTMMLYFVLFYYKVLYFYCCTFTEWFTSKRNTGTRNQCCAGCWCPWKLGKDAASTRGSVCSASSATALSLTAPWHAVADDVRHAPPLVL
ncbi:unnamed protein product, partial [Ixodes persulcatus]